MNIEPIVVLMTAASHDEAARLADMLVESRLAACVQILPQMESVYRWKGNVEHSAEVLLIAKTELRKFAELDQRVRSVHSYDTPEIVAITLVKVSPPYLEWLTANVGER